MRRPPFFTLAAVLVVIFVLLTVVSAPASDDRFVDFVVRRGDTARTIGSNLQKAYLVRSSFAFAVFARITGAHNRIQAGSYKLSTSLGLFEVLSALSGGSDAAALRVTLIEGWTNKQYIQYLAERGFDAAELSKKTESARELADTHSFLSGLPDSASVEGYLYPDTYAITLAKDSDLLIQKMLTNFDVKVDEEIRTEIAKAGMTLHEAIILASIIEREVSSSPDRRTIADIFLKRLAEGIALQSDATINYITGSGRSRSTADDLSIDSPYNTYKYRGLTPGPIGNPGIESIRAVARPDRNEYYYFLTDQNGTVHYARDFDEHKKNKDRYLN